LKNRLNPHNLSGVIHHCLIFYLGARTGYRF
jgi:hypothetical protein